MCLSILNIYVALKMFLSYVLFFNSAKNKLGKKQTRRYDQEDNVLRSPWTHTHGERWSELECDTDFLGTTGRREVQLAHKQEMAGTTTQWGFLYTTTTHHPPPPPLLLLPSTHHTIPHFSLTHLSLWSFANALLSSCSLMWPPSSTPTSLYLSSYSSLHILISSLLDTRPILAASWAKSLNENKKL